MNSKKSMSDVHNVLSRTSCTAEDMVDPVDALEERSGDASVAWQLGGLLRDHGGPHNPFNKALFLGGVPSLGGTLRFPWYLQ